MALRVLVVTLLTVRFCLANEVAPPPLTEKDLHGRWEGAALDFGYWFRMDIFPNGGYLAVVQRGYYALYKLEESKITGRNNVKLRFRGLREKFPSAWDTVRVEAIGYALPWGDGELHSNLTQLSASNARLNFRVEFEKGTAPSRDFSKMIRRADQLMRDAKRSHL